MKNLITRRAALLGVASMPVAGAGMAADVPSATRRQLDELVADYWLKDAEVEALDARLNNLYASTVLPTESIERGRRPVVDRETGETRMMPIVLRCVGSIEKLYQPYLCFSEAENQARSEKCAEAMQELEAKQAERDVAIKAAGIYAAEDLVNVAYRQIDAIWEQIVRWKPGSLEEANCRSRFMLDRLRGRHEFDVGDLALLFGATEDQAEALEKIDYVWDGLGELKFECRGDPSDVASYVGTFDKDASDDREAYLALLKAKAA